MLFWNFGIKIIISPIFASSKASQHELDVASKEEQGVYSLSCLVFITCVFLAGSFQNHKLIIVKKMHF